METRNQFVTQHPRDMAISPEWLTWVLRDGEWMAPSASVVAMESQPIGSGYGFMSKLARLRIRVMIPDPEYPTART